MLVLLICHLAAAEAAQVVALHIFVVLLCLFLTKLTVGLGANKCESRW